MVHSPKLGLVGLLSAVLFSTTACTNTDAPPASADFEATTADFTAITRLLDQRAEALNAGDRTEFDATVDPQATQEFRDLQASYFGNLQELGATRIGYDVEDVGVTPIEIEGNSDPVLAPVVTEHLLLPWTDRRPVGSDVSYTFVRRGGQWFLGAEVTDDPAHYAGKGNIGRLWAGAPLVVEHRGNIVVAVDQQQADELDDLTDRVVRDLKEVTASVDRSTHQPILVDATSSGPAVVMDPSEDDELANEAAAVTFTARAYGPHAMGDAYVPAGMRIKINPHDLDYLLRDDHVMRHELTHFVLEAYNGLVPLWLSEGIAEYVGYDAAPLEHVIRDNSFFTVLMSDPQELPTSGVFGLNAQKDYLVARAAATWLIDEFGMPRVLDLMDAYRRTDGLQYRDFETPQVLRATLGITESELDHGAFALLAEIKH